MAEKKRGLFDRLMLGKEKSEDYARNTLPTNRWELFWDIFKSRFGKLIIVNILMLIFCIPLAVLLFIRYGTLMSYGAFYPFSQGFGLGYMAPSSMVGYAENIVFQVNLLVYLALPFTVIFAAVGIAGGAYVIRNMVWTEGVFVANDFWRGIKINIKQMLMIGILFSFVFYGSTLYLAYADRNLAIGNGIRWLWVTSKVFTYITLIFFSIMTLHMITMSVTYNMRFWSLVRNSFLFTIALGPQNVFFALLVSLPFLLLFVGGMLFAIGFLVVLLFGLSFSLLVWTDYSQWAYDKFINDKVAGAQKNRGIYERAKNSESAALKKYKEQIDMAKYNSLNNRPIKPITDDELKVAELPAMFSRADLEKLRESKQAIYDDHARYVEEHKNDEEFREYNEQQAKLSSDGKKSKHVEKARKELAKRNKLKD